MLPFSDNRSNPGYQYVVPHPLFGPNIIGALLSLAKLAHFRFKTISQRNVSLLVIGDSSAALTGHLYRGRNDVKDAIQIEARPHYKSVTVAVTIGALVNDVIEAIEAYAAQWAEGDIALIRADIVIVGAANDALGNNGPLQPDKDSIATLEAYHRLKQYL